MIKVGNNNLHLRGIQGRNDRDHLNESGTVDVISDDQTSSSSELNEGLVSKE